MPNAEPKSGLVPFADYVGVQVTEASGGRAVASLPSRAELMNHLSLQHAGALYTVAETASGAAMISAVGPLLAEAVPLVRSSSASFRRVASGTIRATAAMLLSGEVVTDTYRREGRVDFPVEVSLEDAGGVEVATMRFEWSLRLRKAE